MKQLNIQGHDLDFWHAEQANPWGCMHHVLYACTGNERFLENVDDMNTEGVERLAWNLGYWPITWYTSLYQVKADEQVWRSLISKFPASYSVWEASIDSLGFENTRHSVAIAVNLTAGTQLEGVPFAVVSDSAVPEFVHYETLEAFLASPYSGAYALTSHYRLPEVYAPEHVWTLDAPHLKDFDWYSYLPAQSKALPHETNEADE